MSRCQFQARFIRPTQEVMCAVGLQNSASVIAMCHGGGVSVRHVLSPYNPSCFCWIRWDGYIMSLPDELPGSPLSWSPSQQRALQSCSVAARLDGLATVAVSSHGTAAAMSTSDPPAFGSCHTPCTELPTLASFPHTVCCIFTPQICARLCI